MGHLVLVRHSTTEASAGGRNLGQGSDPPLTAEGRELAALLGKRLAQELVEMPTHDLRLVTSPARRCRETLAEVASALGSDREPEVEAGLMEIEYGAFQRQVTLAEDIDPDNATATYERGLLTVLLPIAPRPSPLRRSQANRAGRW